MNQHISPILLALPTPEVPSLYADWLGDPGPAKDDPNPFPIQVGEFVQFAHGAVTARFIRRASDGLYIFEPQNGAATILRSAWRLKKEFESGVLIRITRMGRAAASAARQRAQQSDVNFLRARATPHFVQSAAYYRVYLEAVLEEDCARRERGEDRLPRSGPRYRGGLAEPHTPPRNLAELIANVALAKNLAPMSWKTLLDPLREVQAAGAIRDVMLGDGRSIRSMPSRLAPEVEEVLRSIVTAEFMTTGGETLRGLEHLTRKKIEEINLSRAETEQLAVPGRDAIRRRIALIPGMEIVAAQQGKRKARYYYRMTGKMPFPDAPMDVVQFDYKTFDITYRASTAILPMYAGMSAGRLTVGLFVDVYTGWPTGFFLSPRKPSRAMFLAALRAAIMEKDQEELSKSGVLRAWLPHGLMSKLATDRALELISSPTHAALEDIGISVVHFEARTPTDKAHVESTFNVWDKLSSKLPGYVGTGPQNKPALEFKDEHLLDIEEIYTRVLRFCSDYMGDRCASTRAMSARRAWVDYQARHPGWAPNLPASAELLDRALTLRFQPKATAEGVRIKGLFFNSEWIRTIRSDCHAHKINPYVTVMVRPHNLDEVIVEHPRLGTFGTAKSMQPTYTAGKDFAQHEVIKAASAHIKRRDGESDASHLARTYAAIVRKIRRGTKNEKRAGAHDAMAFLVAGIGPGSPGTRGGEAFCSEGRILPAGADMQNSNPAAVEDPRSSSAHAAEDTISGDIRATASNDIHPEDRVEAARKRLLLSVEAPAGISNSWNEQDQKFGADDPSEDEISDEAWLDVERTLDSEDREDDK